VAPDPAAILDPNSPGLNRYSGVCTQWTRLGARIRDRAFLHFAYQEIVGAAVKEAARVTRVAERL